MTNPGTNMSHTDGDAPLLLVVLQDVGLWWRDKAYETLPASVDIIGESTIQLVWENGRHEEYVFAHVVTARIAYWIIRSEMITEQWEKSVDKAAQSKETQCETGTEETKTKARIRTSKKKMTDSGQSGQEKRPTLQSMVKARKKSYKRPSTKDGK